MHTFETEKLRIHYNSDMSGNIRIYNSETQMIIEVPAKDIIDFVLGNAITEIRSASDHLQELIKMINKNYQETPPTPKVVEVFQLMQLIDTLDDELMLLVYSGDTSITGLVFSDSLTKENVAYLKEKYGDHHIASIDTSSEGHLIILMD